MSGSSFSFPVAALITPNMKKTRTARLSSQEIQKMTGTHEIIIEITARMKTSNPCLTWNFTKGSFLASVKRGMKKRI